MANGHGGKREGAGRKQGVLNRKTQSIAEEMVRSGALTPLEVMVKAMMRHVKARRWDQAAAIAKDAAPYVHHKLATMQVTRVPDVYGLNPIDVKPEIIDAVKLVESRFTDDNTSKH